MRYADRVQQEFVGQGRPGKSQYADHSPTEGSEKDTGLGVAFNEKSASREFTAIQSKRGIPGQTSRCVRKQLT